MTFKERLEQLEASHIHLMTEHEVFVREQEKAWQQHAEWFEKFEAQREKDREHERRRGEELDRRIAELVSGIGEFMRRETNRT